MGESRGFKMPKRAAPATTAERRSSRARTQPSRFNPCGSAGIPDALEEMAQTVAAEVCAHCPLQMSTDAVKELQNSLLPAMAAFLEAAHATALKRGSDAVEDADFDAVL